MTRPTFFQWGGLFPGTFSAGCSYELVMVADLDEGAQPLGPLGLGPKTSLWATGSSHVVVAILLTSEVDAICRDLAR